MHTSNEVTLLRRSTEANMGRIIEIKLGAPKGEGGTREKSEIAYF